MTANNLSLFSLAMVLPLFLGCQPARNQSAANVRVGRSARGTNGSLNSALGTNALAPGGKAYGSISNTYGDQAFASELYLLNFPSMLNAPADQQLGNVSASANSSTGVRFYGSAVKEGGVDAGTNGTANFNRDTMSLHIEITDDKAAQNPSVTPPLTIQISSDQEGFVNAGGTISGSEVNMYFQDRYGTINLIGVINNQTFAGKVLFSNSATSNQQHELGTFSIPTCGFFQCY